MENNKLEGNDSPDILNIVISGSRQRNDIGSNCPQHWFVSETDVMQGLVSGWKTDKGRTEGDRRGVRRGEESGEERSQERRGEESGEERRGQERRGEDRREEESGEDRRGQESG